MNRNLFFIALLLVAKTPVIAQQYFHIDSTFGTNGYFVSGQPGWDQASDLAVQPDCKIVTVGHVGTFFNGTCVVSRLLSNGSLDLSFGFNGRTTFSFNSPDQLNAVALQSDGKIVVAGGDLNDGIGVARLLPNGDLDPSFGTGGKVMFTSPSSDLDAPATGLAIQPNDGKILVATQADAGNGQNDNMAVVLRLMPNGSPDPSFSGDGKAYLDIFPGLHERISAFLLQPDGKILVGGEHFSVSPMSPTLVRLLPDGSLDTGFGNEGFVVTLVDEVIEDLGILPDGKIIAVLSGTFDVFTIARFLPNGEYDTSFGSGGVVFTNLGFLIDARAYSLVLQEDSKIVVAGYKYDLNPNPYTTNFFVGRYNADGTIDSTFAPDGFFTPNINGKGEILYGIAPHREGFVAAGRYVNEIGQNDLVLLRLTNGDEILPPMAGFTVNTTNLTASFTNTSLRATSYLWDFGDGQISTLPEPDHSYANSGVYTVTLIAYNFCIADTVVQTIGVVSAKTPVWLDVFRLYPNPNNGIFTLEMSGEAADEVEFALFSPTGQLLRREAADFSGGSVSRSFNYGDLSPALYLLHIRVGEKSAYLKVSVQR